MQALSTKDREELNIAVFQYLKSNRYPNAAEIFQEEASLDVSQS